MCRGRPFLPAMVVPYSNDFHNTASERNNAVKQTNTVLYPKMSPMMSPIHASVRVFIA